MTFLRWRDTVFAIAIGLFGFWLIMGSEVLDPLNIAWLGDGYDPTQHYLGWVFYRHSPWTFPIGLNPSYGLEISSAVVFSDSIPVLAFLFKPFASILPEPFQYIGLWNCLCFVLQAWFAWLLVSLITNNFLSRILATALIVFSPPMLFRLGLHAALAGHFLVLAGLYLNLRKNKIHQNRWWLLLMSVAALTHFYLFTMAFALWVADLIQRHQPFSKEHSRVQMAKELGIALALLLFIAWQAGYFSVSTMSAATGDYGFYNFNLLAPFQSDGWSYIFKSWPHPNNGEGFNYFGLGIIFVLLMSCRYWFIKIKPQARLATFKLHWPLVLILVLLFLFAMTNHIVIGPWEFVIPLPDFFYRLASILRGSGRLFWPVWYVLVLYMVYGLTHSYTARVTNLILFLALLIQISDTSAGWLGKRAVFMTKPATELFLPLADSFWGAAAKKYQKIERSSLPISPVFYYVGWDTWAKYAAKYHLGTNSAWLSRYNQTQLNAAKAALNERLSTGQYDPNTLYILDNDKVMPALLHLDPSKDLLARIDGFYVLAPGWQACTSCPRVLPEQVMSLSSFMPARGEMIEFGKDKPPKYLLNISQGWAHPEPWGIWSDGGQAQLILGLPSEPVSTLTLTVRAFVAPTHPTQEVRMVVNGQAREEVLLKGDANNRILLAISKTDQALGFLNIEFFFKNPARPKNLGLGDDERLLSIGIENAVFH